MTPRKPIDPVLVKLSKLKREPVPTFFTLLLDQDRPHGTPELRTVREPIFADCECRCEKALERFEPSRLVISDGVYKVPIMCSTKVGVKRVVGIYEKISKLEPSTDSTSRQTALQSLVFEFAQQCEHEKIRRKTGQRTYCFVPCPIIPRFRLSPAGVPIMNSDSDSDADDEEPDEAVASSDQAMVPWTTIINNALVERLEQKLPRSPKNRATEMPGFIYILKSPSIPEMFKIGVTTKDPAVRREQWDRCYRDIQLHAYTSLVPYAKLVENIIHTELVVQRYKEDCSNCKGNKTRARAHTEWFKMTEQLAEQTVMRWAKWMGSRPYHVDTRKLRLTWLNRIEKAREKAYRPGVDHIQYTEKTWQDFTDMPRPKGTRDDSGAVELIRCPMGKSPFSA